MYQESMSQHGYCSELVNQMFAGSADDCERLVAAMQYCAFIPTVNTFSNAVIVTLLEKGVLYRGMLDLVDLSLLDQCFYIHNKFTEFHERLMVIDVEVDITKPSFEELLFSTISRVKTNFITKRESMPSLKIFQIIKLGPIVMIFDNKDDQNVDACKVILINDSVIMIDMSWQDIAQLAHDIVKLHFPLLQEQSSFLSSAIVCLVRDKDSDDAEVQDVHAESYDDQLVEFHDYMHACKKEEAAGSIFELRHSIKEIYQDLQQRQLPSNSMNLDHTLDISHDDVPPPPPTTEYPPPLENTYNILSSNVNNNSALLTSQGGRMMLNNTSEGPDTSSITPPPQVPFTLRPPTASSTTARCALSSPALLPPGTPHDTVENSSEQRDQEASTRRSTSRPQTSSCTNSDSMKYTMDYSHMYDEDDDEENRVHVLPLKEQPQAQAIIHESNHFLPSQDNDWADGSQSITVFQHETWGRGTNKVAASLLRNSNDSTVDISSPDDHVQCNQSLSELSPSRLKEESFHGNSFEKAVEEKRHGFVKDEVSNVDAIQSPFVQTERRLSRIEDLLRGDIASFSVDHQDTQIPSHEIREEVVSDGINFRTLDEIIRDTASDVPEETTISTRTSAAGKDVGQSIDNMINSNAANPTVASSPIKSIPQLALLSPVKNDQVNKKEKKPISESLHRDLMASEADENFLSYAQRAYMAMRDRAVENTDYNLSITMSTTQPFSRPATALIGQVPTSDTDVKAFTNPPTTVTTVSPDKTQRTADLVVATPPASIIATATTPKSLTSVCSANHENFDDFFSGMEEHIVVPARQDIGFSHDEDDHEVENEEDYVVIHHIHNQNDPIDNNAVVSSQVNALTAVALDDLLDDLSIHTPGGGRSLSMSITTSSSRPNTQQHDSSPPHPLGISIALLDNTNVEAMSEAATPVVQLVIPQHLYSHNLRKTPDRINVFDTNQSKEFEDDHAPTYTSPRSSSSHGNSRTIQQEVPNKKGEASIGIISQRPSTGNLVLLQTIMERMKTQRSAFEHRHVQHVIDRTRHRLHIGRQVLKILQQQQVEEEDRLREKEDAETWDRQRWPPLESKQHSSLKKSPLAKNREFDSVATALGQHPPQPQSYYDMPSQSVDQRWQVDTRPISSTIPHRWDLDTDNEEKHNGHNHKKLDHVDLTNEKSYNPSIGHSILPSPNQLLVHIRSQPALNQPQVQKVDVDMVGRKPAPVAWQVDLDQGGESSIGGQSQTSVNGLQRPRSRPRSWSANRSRSNVNNANITNNFTSGSNPPFQINPTGTQENHSNGSVMHISDLIVGEDPQRGQETNAVASLSPATSRTHTSQATSVARPRSQSAQRSRVGGAGTAHAANTGASSKLSNFVQTKNAVSYVCLAGGHQEEKRLEVLDLLEFYAQGKLSSTLTLQPNEFLLSDEMRGKISQFVLMFYKAKTLAFKGIYALDPKSKYLVRIYGKGPHRMNSEGEVSDIAKEYLKFETSSKSFKTLPVKSLTSTVDAIVLVPPKSRAVSV